jgi:site-specific recombinase XerD
MSYKGQNTNQRRTDMNTALTVHLPSPFIPLGAGKDQSSRLNQFEQWRVGRGLSWNQPRLDLYCAYLLERGLRPSSVNAHLGTIRKRYRNIVQDNTTREALYNVAAQGLDTLADSKAFVDEVLTRLSNDVRPGLAGVKEEDRQEDEHTRLPLVEALAYAASPGEDTLQALRDKALLSLLVATGIREQELCNLKVQDLRQELEGMLCLRVFRGKGDKTRLVPYGSLVGALDIVERWLEAAGITEGYVFRGFYKGGKRIRAGQLTTRQVQRIVHKYGPVAPHDLRRSYARICYVELGMDILAISQNMGHTSIEMTRRYIGNLEAGTRAPRGPEVVF